MRCGLCGRRILFYEKVINMEFNGNVHEKCTDEFNKNNVLFQLKGMVEEDLITEVKNEKK